MSSKKKIIFILCAIRSGSTLLKNMLDQHPAIFAPAELHILPFDSLNDMELNFRGTTLGKGLVESIQKLKACSEKEALLTYEHFKINKFSSQAIYNWFLTNMEEEFLVDKSPTYALRYKTMERTERLDATTYYIHLIRHPVASIDSIICNDFVKLFRMVHCNGQRIMDRYERANKSYTSDFVFTEDADFNRVKKTMTKAEGLWRITNRNVLKRLKDIPSSRAFTLTYESLVNDSEKIMHQLCDFLDIAPNSAMCRPFQKKSSFKETIGDPNFSRHKAIRNQNYFSLAESLGEQISVKKETIDIAIAFDYLCWESEQFIPLLPAEQAFFEQNKYPNNYCLITTFDAPKLIDFKEKKLIRSLKELMIENPLLSSVFVQEKGQWERKIGSLPEVSVCQLFCAEGEDPTTIFETYTNTWINNLDIQSGPLFAICYIYKEEQLTIRYIIHHLLMDGMAVIKFHKELWNKILLPTSDLAFSAKNEIRAYLEKLHTLELVEEFNYSDMTPCFKDIEPSVCYDSQEEFTVKLPKQVVHNGRFSYDEIACALYASLEDYSGLQKIVIAHRFHHRTDFGENWGNLFAWLADDLPIVLDVKGDQLALLNQFRQKRKIASRIPNRAKKSRKGVLLHEYCQVRLNYIPIIRKSNDSANLFNLPTSTLSFDKRNSRDYVIDFIVREYQDHFELIIRYSKAQFNTEFIQNLVKKWEYHFDKFSLLKANVIKQ